MVDPSGYGVYSISNNVLPTTKADFTASQTSICVGSTIQFSSTSNGLIDSYNWNFNGGLASSTTEENPSVVFDVPGVYTIDLTVTEGAHSDSETKTNFIEVHALPTAVISGDNFICAEQEATISVELTGQAPWTISVDNGTDINVYSDILNSPF